MVARGVQNSTSMTTTRVTLGGFTIDPESRLRALKQMPTQLGLTAAFQMAGPHSEQCSCGAQGS